jgi:membrane protease YdiL (CAAX protease family)
MILTQLVALVVLAWLGVRPWDLDKSPSTKATVVLLSQMLWSAAALLYLFAAVRKRAGGPFWRTIGWRALRPRVMTGRTAALGCLLGGAALAITTQFASALIGKKTKLPIEDLFQSRQSVLYLMVLGIAVAPLIEETIFRGYIYPVVARSFGVPIGVLITGALFGLLHAAQLWGGWGQIALLVLVGIVMTYVRARSGTVLASYLFHLGYNTILFIGLYFATGGLRHFSGGP